MKDIFVIGIDSEVPSAIAGVEVKPFEALLENDNGPLLSPETTIDPKSDIWLLPFSSGTTGLPKGTVSRNLCNCVESDSEFFEMIVNNF